MLIKRQQTCEDTAFTSHMLQASARQLEKQLHDGQNAFAELSDTHDRLEQQTRQVQQETQSLRRDKLSLIKEKQLEQVRCWAIGFFR